MNRLTDAEIAAHVDDLLKPPGSLGQLERLAARLCQIQQSLAPRTRPRRLVLFAADHGVAGEGVTAWPSDVTEMMVRTIRAGKSASAVLARQTQTQLCLIDVGTFEATESNSQSPEPDPAIRFVRRRVRAGSRNLAREPALTKDELRAAMAIGEQSAAEAARDGVRVVAAGEMGIGNTTPASCLAMLLADLPLHEAVGRGAGVDDRGLARKRAVVAAAVERSRLAFVRDPWAAMAGVGGLEIGAMAGFFCESFRRNLTIVLDGFVASAAALIAEHARPGTATRMIAAHRSAEPGQGRMLEKLRCSALLDWQMRLGEGSGALLVMPLLDAAAAIVGEMGTFTQAGLDAVKSVERD